MTDSVEYLILQKLERRLGGPEAAVREKELAERLRRIDALAEHPAVGEESLKSLGDINTKFSQINKLGADDEKLLRSF